VGPCVALLKLVVVGVVAPSVGRGEEVDNADEVAPPDAGFGVQDVVVALPDVGRIVSRCWDPLKTT
jgi:hypothetical protein